MVPTKKRKRGSSFGTVLSVGTPGHPAFAIRWWEGTTRKKQSGFRTRTEALDALARVRSGLSDGSLLAKRATRITFDVAAQEWLDLHSKPNLRCHNSNEQRYRMHVKDEFGELPLTAITPAKLLTLRTNLENKSKALGGTLADGTVNLVLALVRAILRFAVDNEHIPSSPTDRVGRGKLMIKLNKSKLAPPVESADQVGRLLQAIGKIAEERHRPGLYGLFSLLAYTGMRRGEACGLRWADVDLKRRLIIVRWSYEKSTKSGRDRLVPIAESLVGILAQHRLNDEYKNELVFPNDADGGMMSPASRLSSVLHEACDRCKLPRIRVHDLRHVFASCFVMSDGNIFTLQQILGHSTPKITSDTYAHLSPDHLAGSADRIRYPAPPKGGKVLPIKSDE